MSERAKFALAVAVFAACWFLPVEQVRLWDPVRESLSLVRWYAREHVLLCLVPAFFIAGAISVFVSQGAVMKYLGPGANKAAAYSVAAVSGTVLAVCSCTVLPLFAGIHRRGAGLGPASAFLYSGPAINVLAIILTARVLGFEIGVARAVGAVLFAVVIGLLMQWIFRREERAREAPGALVLPSDASGRSIGQDGLTLLAMVGILVFANWGRPLEGDRGLWSAIFGLKWWITGAFGAILAATLLAWYRRDEVSAWGEATWSFAKQILPLLLAGVLAAGFLLGGPEGADRGLLPNAWIERAVGGNSLFANLFASVAGALMYFATLTEVPIVSGLQASGMGSGPALALLLAGPALSLPSLLVIRSVLGTKKTAVYLGLVVGMSTIAGLMFGIRG
ncbi:MAG TPA: permease [Candidatus Eisenbacteria bacterium]|nr:permease [Candidatus Eisenbacteria bacterium]